jgi:fermentation-respiration switch protein FrsA (DUF1100 family)
MRVGLVLKNTIVVLISIYVLLLLAAYFGQRKLLYFPDRKRTAPEAVGLVGVAERVIATPDGEQVIAWYAKAKPGKPTLLYFHGNGGSLAARATRIEYFTGEGWGIYIVTYRGYGGSTGSPTEAANIADARTAYDALVNEGVPANRIILYGESLGTGIAVRLASERLSAGLILDAPYTSVVDIAARRYPIFPVALALHDRYDSKALISQVKVPVLVLHGERDRVIPIEMGRALLALANEPKRFVSFPNGGHSDLYDNGNNALAAVREWIAGLQLTQRGQESDHSRL